MRYYVYELIDPRTGAVFYVGKGQWSRIDAHEREARQGKKSRKCQTISEIWDAGLSVKKRIVCRFKTDVEAFEFEAKHVAAVGRENLTNMRDGGMGGRVKFGAPVLLEEARVLLGALREWATRGRVKSISLGKYGVLSVEDIMARYKERLSEIAAVVGFDAIFEEGRKMDLTVRFEHG
jgi:hypothetical protein